jgi:hypothetical protein
MTSSRPREHLWIPIVAPVVWSTHFTVVYAWLAMACGRLGDAGGFDRARTGIAVITIVAVILIAMCFGYGFHRHGRRLPDKPNDDGTPEDRTRFMAFTTMLLAGLSLAATLYVALAAVAVGGCL